MAFTETYVSVAGGGDHDGSSEANAWTFAEMIAAAPAAETRVNVKYGAYSEGVTTLPANGTAKLPIVIRGYYATIGDLDNIVRLDDGTLDVDNASTPCPNFTITGLWTPSPYCVLQNLDITGALSSYLIGSTANDFFGLVNCRVVNTQNNAAAGTVQGDNNVFLFSCDFSCTGANHGIVVDSDNLTIVNGCRFAGTLNTATLLSVNDGFITNSAFYGMGNTSKGLVFQLTPSGYTICDGCTFYNLGIAIQLPNALPTSIVYVTNCHVTDCAKFLDSLYVATDEVPVIEVCNRSRDNTTPRTGILSVLSGEVTTDAGDYTTDYVSSTNVRLKSTAAGKSKAMQPYRDIGAYQCAYPTLPAAGDVDDTAADYGYADALIEATCHLPAEAEVQDGVFYGEDETEFEGTYEGGGGGEHSHVFVG